MKRIITFLLVLLFTVSLCSCSDNTPETPNDNDAPSSTQITVDSSKDNTSDHGEEITDVTDAVIRAYKTAPASDFEYEVDGDGIKITKYIGNDTIVVIPDMIDGKSVTELKSYLFANESAVKGVLIPKTVLSLKYTFTNNDDIQVVICEGVEKIQDFAFGNCAKLHTLCLGERLSELGQNCISVCPDLKELVISPSLKHIDDTISWSIFYSCPNLTIIGESGSYIESFCATNNIPFKTK